MSHPRPGEPARTRLSPDEIAAVRDRHTILDVLHRAGLAPLPHHQADGDVMISCPRPGHEDSTPSCVIHPSRGLFYCFGCGAHGDVFTLARELTGLTSLARIAELLDTGQPLIGSAAASSPHMNWRPVTTTPPAAHRDGPVLNRTPPSRVLECNAQAWTFLTGPRPADRARYYLARRGIDPWALESVARAPVAGYAPTGRDALSAHMQRRGFTDDEIIDAGWSLHRHGRLVDRFNDRVLFPICDDHGQLLGVIGRDVTNRARQKYLNTARTAAFCKGEILYRPVPGAVPDGATVLICEGPLDALAVAAAATDTSDDAARIVPVAPSGTALTDQQAARALALTAQPPILCADGDPAGREAAAKWADTFARTGRVTRTITVPDGQDPASWLAEHGARRLAALLSPAASPCTAPAAAPAPGTAVGTASTRDPDRSVQV